MSDPTKTLTLRSRTVAETNRRYNQLKGLINESVLKNRVFHSGRNLLFSNAEDIPEGAFDTLSPAEQLVAWNEWVLRTTNEVILGVPAATPPDFIPPFDFLVSQWMISSIIEGYRRGGETENRWLRQFDAFFGDFNIRAPRHETTLRIIANTVYSDLKGVTRTMADQMTQVISRGMLEGQGAAELAKNINDRVDKIGKVRSRLIARTEIVNANNLAKTVEDQRFEEETGIALVELWTTAGDEKVRERHVERDGRYYTIDRARQLIGEPNCRCTVRGVPQDQVPQGRRVLS